MKYIRHILKPTHCLTSVNEMRFDTLKPFSCWKLTSECITSISDLSKMQQLPSLYSECCSCQCQYKNRLLNERSTVQRCITFVWYSCMRECVNSVCVCEWDGLLNRAGILRVKLLSREEWTRRCITNDLQQTFMKVQLTKVRMSNMTEWWHFQLLMLYH